MKKIILILSMMLLSFTSSADIVVIVNASNTEKISTVTLSNLYLGKAKSFPSGQKAIPLMLDYELPELGPFLAKYLGKDTGQFRAYWAQLIFTGNGIPPQTYKHSQDIVDLVARNPDVIGIVESSAVRGNVKVVSF